MALRVFFGVLLIAAVGMSPFSSLYAQDSQAIAIQLMNRISAIEAENRDLRGQLEEAQHKLETLDKRIDTLSADVDYRFTNPDSGGGPLSSSAPLSSGREGNSSASLSTSRKALASASEEYEKARTLLEQGEYEAAERAFADFVAAFPKDEFAGPAQYWLGVTFFVRGQHEKAAAAFAKGYKTYPKSSKAPDNLLKLARSLAALDRKADACTTLEQLSSEYPKSHVREVENERRKLQCK